MSTDDKLQNPNILTSEKNSGIGSKFKPFPKVTRSLTKVEILYTSNSSNSYMVLGKDRVAGSFSGEGGVGSDFCDAIDIVAGPLGEKLILEDESGNKISGFNPNFNEDKSRIYITQKGSIDDYFGLEDGILISDEKTNKTPIKKLSSRGKAAIAIKSDHIRLISRESIKIVSSGTDEVDNNGGVYLIAENNQSTLEPMVLGDKLVDYLDENLIKSLGNFIQIVYDFMNQQVEFNSKVIEHDHLSPFFAKPIQASPSLRNANSKTLEQFKSILNSIKLASNNEINNKIQLLPLSKGYILSKYHKLN
jgi:hypothetical protein